MSDVNQALLINSTLCGDIGNVRHFLDKGADPNIQDGNGWTALHWAVHHNNNSKIVKLLLDRGADINVKNIKGNTPVSCAIKNRFINPDIFFTLLIYGATLSEDDKKGISQNGDLKKCLDAFGQIKAMPYLGRLIKAYHNKDKDTIANFTGEAREAIAKELKEIKKCYSASGKLLFISKCLDDFVYSPLSDRNRKSLAKPFIYGGGVTLASLTVAAALYFSSSQPDMKTAALVFAAISIPVGLAVGLAMRYCIKPELKLRDPELENHSGELAK